MCVGFSNTESNICLLKIILLLWLENISQIWRHVYSKEKLGYYSILALYARHTAWYQFFPDLQRTTYEFLEWKSTSLCISLRSDQWITHSLRYYIRTWVLAPCKPSIRQIRSYILRMICTRIAFNGRSFIKGCRRCVGHFTWTTSPSSAFHAPQTLEFLQPSTFRPSWTFSCVTFQVPRNILDIPRNIIDAWKSCSELIASSIY